MTNQPAWFCFDTFAMIRLPHLSSDNCKPQEVRQCVCHNLFDGETRFVYLNISSALQKRCRENPASKTMAIKTSINIARTVVGIRRKSGIISSFVRLTFLEHRKRKQLLKQPTFSDALEKKLLISGITPRARRRVPSGKPRGYHCVVVYERYRRHACSTFYEG